MIKTVKKVSVGLFAATVVVNLFSCGGSGMHNGRLPFSLMEKPKSKRSAEKSSNVEVKRMGEVLSYAAAKDTKGFRQKVRSLQVGDVVAFHMSRKESWQYLKKAKIQKIPYELFHYGHLAMVVDDPDGGKGSKLLQLAMKQNVNTDSGLEYLKDKNWTVFRPEKVDQVKLREFVKVARERGSSIRKAYDYSGAFGLKNTSDKPDSKAEISHEYTCCTLISAALYYAGYELHCTKRAGVLDIVTPKQVVTSWGSVRKE